MKILIISDIHGNQEAMEACLTAVAGGYEQVYNLGDVVGYGASPNEVVDRSRALGGVFVRGNHDKACSGVADASDFNHIAALAAFWTQKQLTPPNLEWVKNLPAGPIRPPDLPRVQCVHGSPLNEDEYIIVVRDAYEPLIESEIPITFFGHTHIQGGFSWHDDQWATLRPVYEKQNEAESFALPLAETTRYLINPGSIGQPRDGDWRAAFAVYDTDAGVITFHRVPYDVESTQRKIFEAKLPDRLATRLREGR
jgi:diadenosine tetraphosphatase ApaH/serine/threonine PP2A family protein phosphatase